MATSYLANPAHTNAIADPTLVPPRAELWSVQYLGLYVQYPLIAGGAVYLLLKTESQAPNQLVALDKRSGATRWGPVDLAGLYAAGHAYDRGRVFALNDDGLVQAFDATSGALLWSTTVSGVSEGAAPPTAYDGVLYVNGPGVVEAIDDATGVPMWSFSTNMQDDTSPAVTDDGVFVSSGCGETYGLDRSSGAVLWHYRPACAGEFSGTPIVFGGRVYVSVEGTDTTTIAIDAHTGELLSSPSFGMPAAFDRTSSFFITADHALENLDLASGATEWMYANEMEVQSIPFVAGGSVYVPSVGAVVAVDESTGVQTWSAEFGGAGPPVGAEGVLVAVAGVDSVTAYGHVDLPEASVVLGDGAPPTPIILASGEDPMSLALDATNVYWANGNTGEVRTLNAMDGTQPWGIAVDATRVYWTAPNFALGGTPTVMSVPIQGGAPVTLATGVQGESMVVGPANVYWTAVGPDAVESVPVNGGSIATYGNEPNGAVALAIDASNLYWCASDGIYQRPLSGGPATVIGPGAYAVAVDTSGVYYAATDTSSTGTIGRIPIGGGTPTIPATGRLGVLVAVAVDDRNVYWVEGEGTIAQGAVAAVQKSGGRVVVLASGLSDPSSVVVDDSGVYFNNVAGGGLIEKIIK